MPHATSWSYDVYMLTRERVGGISNSSSNLVSICTEVSPKSLITLGLPLGFPCGFFSGFGGGGGGGGFQLGFFTIIPPGTCMYSPEVIRTSVDVNCGAGCEVFGIAPVPAVGATVVDVMVVVLVVVIIAVDDVVVLTAVVTVNGDDLGCVVVVTRSIVCGLVVAGADVGGRFPAACIDAWMAGVGCHPCPA